ncbi:MAG: hypothetical protein ACRCYQ_15650 [Nocardioides sp.]
MTPPPRDHVQFDDVAVERVVAGHREWVRRVARIAQAAQAIPLPSQTAVGSTDASSRLLLAYAGAAGRVIGSYRGQATAMYDSGDWLRRRSDRLVTASADAAGGVNEAVSSIS